MAEMLRLPAHAQARILAEQKYPKQEPQAFRTPYYQQALVGIRNYFRSGRNVSQISIAMSKIEGLGQEARRLNNGRVMTSFQKSTLAERALILEKVPHWRSSLGTVEFRLSPDLNVLENGENRLLFFNFRNMKFDPEVAKLTAEISHWVLERNGIKMPIDHIEYVDLFSGDIYAIKKRRAATTKAVAESAKIIETLWPTL
ncbi:MAG TPA: hypothetical protein VFH59_03230 [Frateuria sp.]|uniref:hypothetical protein n=1 Tax=Frateuria sp. TaxID=2211372 RepID=UPI002D804910|nr:hypothetical protein [Frateuria sp.]HET6804440.1 hypothetical protein [Frateuria sp.]